MSYRTLNTMAAVMALSLALWWALAPAQYLMLWSQPHSEATAMVMRRGAVLWFAFAVLLFLSRDLKPGPERNTICFSVIAGCGLLAVQALYEMLAGHAGPAVWGAVAVEVTLATAYTWVQRRAVT